MKNYTEINTWEDVCAAQGIDPVSSLAWAEHCLPEDKIPQVALFKLNKLSKTLWNDEVPSLKKTRQEKWFLVASNNDQSGFGFSYSFTHYDDTYADVGARLYPSEEVADHVGNNAEFWGWHRDLGLVEV